MLNPMDLSTTNIITVNLLSSFSEAMMGTSERVVSYFGFIFHSPVY